MTTSSSTVQELGSDPDLDAYVAAECARLSVPGCAVADTLFLIGSTSKTLTATTVMSLVQEGRLSLDDLGRPPAPEPEVLPLTPELLAEYVGSYDAGQWDLHVTSSDGRLFVQMKLTDVPPDTPEEVLAAFDVPPSEYVLTGRDVIAPAGSPTSCAGDFIRGADGEVAWLRQGLRMARRRCT